MKLKRSYPILLAVFLVWPLSANADSVQVSNPWVRATAPGQKVAGIYMELKADADMRLVSGSSPLCGRVELHTMRMEGGMMVMRPLPEIELPKGQTVSLKPGGLHVMCIDMKKPLKTGEQLPLTLVTRSSGGQEQKLQVAAEVRASAEGHTKHHGY